MSESTPLRLETPDQGEAVRLRVAPSDRPGIRISPAAAQRLRSVHVAVLETEAAVGVGRSWEFTREVPNVAEDKLAHLDERGFARVGTPVRPGDIVVGRVHLVPDPFPPSEEEKLLRAIFGERADAVARDSSLRVPPTVKGVVTAVRLGPPEKKGKRQAVEVEVTELRDLAVGDLLVAEDGRRGLVSAIEEDPERADLRWGDLDLVAGDRLVSKLECAEDVLEARSIGPYSLVTQQPLGGKASFGGQRVGPAELMALEARGAWWCARELLTFKSDDIPGRLGAYEGIVLGRDRMANGVPEAVKVLERELAAVGFVVERVDPAAAPTSPPERSSNAGPVPADASSAPAGLDALFQASSSGARGPADRSGWRLRFPTSAAVRASSNGLVKKPETINYRTYLPEPDGLFCARIFGPVKDYECQCGKYRQMKHRGVVCEVCGVEVIQCRVRRERFGHVELARPLLHPLAFDLVAVLLGRTAADLKAILYGEARLDRSPAGDDWQSTGAGVLRDGLAALDLGLLAAEDGERGVVARAMLEQGLHPSDLVFDAWPVLPPDLRPLVPLDGGRFATSDLNDHYRRLINRNNRTRRLLELNAPGQILVNEQQLLQRSLDSLVHNGLRQRKLTGPDRRPLRSLLDLLAGPQGRFAANLAGKRVDYSGRARVVLDSALRRGELRLPRIMALELFKPWVYCALEQAGRASTIKQAKALVEGREPVAMALLEAEVTAHRVLVFPQGPAPAPTTVGAFRVALWDAPAIALHPDDAADLQLAWDEPVMIHVPLDGRAMRESRELLGVRPSAPRGVSTLHARLRRWIVSQADCGSEDRGLDTCAAASGVCAACADRPLGTPIGLEVAEALAPLGRAVERAPTLKAAIGAGADPRLAALLFRAPRRGWITRAARIPGPRDLGRLLVEAALKGEVDPVTDPETRSLLGRIGWDPELDHV